jgi:hypothetical protein
MYIQPVMSDTHTIPGHNLEDMAPALVGFEQGSQAFQAQALPAQGARRMQ